MTKKDNVPAVPRLLLNLQDAAMSLGISDRMLWGMTKAGTIPYVQIGNRKLYSVAALEQWVCEQIQNQKGDQQHDDA